MISLDIANAFNSVDWTLINETLLKYQIPVYLRKIIDSFIEERTIQQDELIFDYNVGVPQGSSLRPIIWNIFMNDIFDIKLESNTKLQAFADDTMVIIRETAVYLFEKSAKIILDKLHEWSIKKKLKFNTSKSNYLIIGPTSSPRRPLVKMNGEKLCIQ